MSTTKHTAEPWAVVPTKRGLLGQKTEDMQDCLEIIQDAKGPTTPVCVMDTFHEVASVANAARIVACVNACAGMEDPAASIDWARNLLTEALSYARHSGWPKKGHDAYLADLEDVLRALGG